MTVNAPSLDEQNRVVDLLSRAESIVRMRREAEQKAKEIIPALFLDMFGDPATNPKGGEDAFDADNERRREPARRMRLSDLVERFEGGKNVEAGAEGGSRYRILKISAVTSGQYDETEAKPAPDAFDPPEQYFVRNGDMLFSRANTEALVGATAIVVGTDGNTLLPDKLWRIVWKVDAPIRPMYMLTLFQNSSTRKSLSKIASGTGGSMKNISQAKLFELRVPIAPMDAQLTFERHALSAMGIAARTRSGAVIAEQAFQSLLAGVFGQTNFRCAIVKS